MTKNWNIIPANESDIPGLVELINDSYRGALSLKGWTSESHLLAGVRTTQDQLRELMVIPNASFFKYEEEFNKPLASVYLEIESDSLYLGMLTVNPELQGRGIGKALLDFAYHYGFIHQLTRVYISVLSPRIELIEWYERNGYIQTGERKEFLGDGKHYIPKVPLELIYMEKRIIYS